MSDTNECDTCAEPVDAEDKYCRSYGQEQGLVTWDHREEVPWYWILLKLGLAHATIEVVETNADYYAIRVNPNITNQT